MYIIKQFSGKKEDNDMKEEDTGEKKGWVIILGKKNRMVTLISSGEMRSIWMKVDIPS